MKFEESSLTGYLVKNLQPLTEADPVILAEYVATLLKKDKPIKELQKLCTENLVDFLGHDAKSFITKLFQALEDGSIVGSTESLDGIRHIESSVACTTVDQNSFSPKPDKLSSSSGPLSDSEEKEFSDDDDDDRNHKHRRRETKSLSLDKGAQEQILRRPNRKRDKPFENGQVFLGSDPQSSEIRKEYDFGPLENPKFEKRRPGVAPLPRAPPDVGQRTRVSQPFRNDTGPRFDLSTSLGRLPIGRGRGRSAGSWNQLESRFNSVETLDFSSQIAPQGPTPPSLFPGRGLPTAASAQSASWGAFGLIHGMPNGALDTLHPLGMQGTLQPPINSSLNIGIPRQRCRDFEERGFCLRGDMCPMEHGVNRIVVEDVQSLSQFNLPVSIPSTRLLGVQGGTGPLPPVTGPSSLLTNSKGLHGKSKPGVTDDGLGLNGSFSSSGAVGEADLYDPDQPLWNNNRPETSDALLRLPSPKIDNTEPQWDDDPSDRHAFRFSEASDIEHSGRSVTAAVGSQGTTSSVWGRIGNSGNRSEMTGKFDSTTSTGTLSSNHEVKDDQEETLTNFGDSGRQGKRMISEEVAPKAKSLATTPRSRSESGRNTGRATQKALRTLFVNGIPLKNNKREALLSHFQKFGEVIDIYIPQNSERAFVQFSMRDEAEAALKAPDAVMGNRFIKLWWANRDSIQDEGESSGNVMSAPSRGAIASTATQSTTDRGKENMPSAAPKPSGAVGSDASLTATVPSKPLGANGPKAAPPPLQKKLETLELLKEELRIKQEILDQKRNDFRRQLDKLEKQAANTVKSEAVCEQAVKRPKVETVSDVMNAATPRPTNYVTTGAQLEAEKMVDKRNLVENIVSPSAKTNSAILQQSPRSLRQPSRLPSSIGTPLMANRFKLDNRPTTFRILPPLPADIANVSVLKEHFSSFGDLSAVELENTEDHSNGPSSIPSQNCSARISFATRRSAERAFQSGKCWQGHNLQFTWLATTGNSNTDHASVEISQSLCNRGPPDAGNLAESSSSSTGKSTSSGTSQAADTGRNRKPENAEGMSSGIECLQKDDVEPCLSSSPTLSSCDKQPHEPDCPVTEDGVNVAFSQ